MSDCQSVVPKPTIRRLGPRSWEARLENYPTVVEVIGVFRTRDEAMGRALARYRELGGR